MHTSQYSWPRLTTTRLIIIGCSLLCVIGLLFVFLDRFLLLQAPAASKTTARPTISIDAGFDDTYRAGYWTPVRVTLFNPGPLFSGKLAVQSFSGEYHTQSMSIISPWRFEQPISLNKGMQKQLTIYAPHSTSDQVTRGFLATLLDEHGKTVTTAETSKPGNEVQPGNTLVGVLSDEPTLQAQLQKVQLPNQTDSVAVSALTAATMPTSETVLENFDVIVLDDFNTHALSALQISTLRIWINRGGVLLIVGGSNWSRTLSSLPTDLIPVTVNGMSDLPAHTHLLTFNGQTQNMTGPITDIDTLKQTPPINLISLRQSKTLSNIETIFATPTNPLIVQAHIGSGTIGFLAFDPASQPLAHWSSANVFWQELLESTLGDSLLIATGSQSYDAGPGQLLTRGGLVSFLTPSMPQGTIAILLLLIGYLLLLGPLRALILHRYPRWRPHNWRIILSTVVLCSFLSYGIAYEQRNSAVTDNTVSIIQVNQDGKMAHVTTYMGVLAPRAGDVNLQIPGNNLTQPIDSPYLDRNSAISQEAASDQSATVTSGSNGTSLTIQNSTLWSVNPVIAEQDQSLQGSITSNLSLRNDQVIGTITNNLASALSDVYILLPHNTIPLGHLAARQTKKISVHLKNTTAAPEITLSDQIDKQAGLPAQYFPYQNKQQPQNDFELHMAMLSALSGVGYNYDPCGGPCQTHAITDKGIIYVTGGQIPDPNYQNDNDPLLLSNTQATLIGWTDQHLTTQDGSTTVNNMAPQGLHMTFIQMPLTFSYAGVLDIPHDFITGHVVDINSFDASAILPGAYSLSSGTVTFALNMPSTPQAYISNITVRIPDLLNNPNGQGNGSITNNSSMKAYIFNWSTNKWEKITLDQQSSFTTDALGSYAGPDGRILVRIGSQNGNQIYFGKPQLNINGNAS